MKRFCAILCSLFLIASFAGVALAETKVMQIPPPKKSNKAVIPNAKATNSKSVTQNKENKNSTVGKKVEKKEDPPKK
jgi:hypothetical protein